ncbi:unnamed protein product [Adineta ricciae]|uniref:Uncharacterized protein n=1 Tax=Adineta ricciae TaxID=249248 RepID=A0A814PPY2_ADIRI|nr:unnamed protein product [Adineta ricciae]
METFQVTTAAVDGCSVHNSKYRSKFNHAVNIIRRSTKFNKHVFHELPKRCCSCDRSQCIDTLRNKYDVHIHIIDRSSSKVLIKKSINVRNKDGIEETVSADKFRVLIRRKSKLTTDIIPFDEIEQEISEKLEEASKFRFIQKEFTFDEKGQFQLVCLPFELTLSSEEICRTVRRSIMKKGENLRSLEDQYNIRLHIIKNEKLNSKYFEKIVKQQNGNASGNFYLFITQTSRFFEAQFIGEVIVLIALSTV